MIYCCMFTLICFAISSAGWMLGARCDLVGVSDGCRRRRSSSLARFYKIINDAAGIAFALSDERMAPIILLNERNNLFQCAHTTSTERVHKLNMTVIFIASSPASASRWCRAGMLQRVYVLFICRLYMRNMKCDTLKRCIGGGNYTQQSYAYYRAPYNVHHLH